MDTLASMNNTDSKQLDIKTIPPGDLKDPEPEEVVKRGKITKKLLKGIEPVACKPLTDEVYNGENFNTLLAILSKLVLSNNIIRFYGILSSDGGATWNQEPSLRQNMPFFLNQLTCLYRNHYSPKIPPRCRSSSNSSINSSLGREILLELDDDDLSLDTLNLDDIEQNALPLNIEKDDIENHSTERMGKYDNKLDCMLNLSSDNFKYEMIFI
ncbi:15488_t:CDS:2 [Entrophospora sp. SA101]|nr:15488_t:CDS:2 [Entrophospora sp. SA101]